MSDLTVDVWETFDFATLNTTNLAANDNNAGGTWTISNAGGWLTTNNASEEVLDGTVNGSLTDVAGTHGLRYASSADYIEGFATYAFAAQHATVSWGFLFRYPTAFLGTFNGGEPDIWYMENDLAQREPYVKLEDDGAAQAHLHLFTPEDNQTTGVLFDANTWVWVTGVYQAAGTHRLRVYDLASGLQIGAEQTRSGSNSGNCSQVTIGSLIGDPSLINQPFEFDDLVLDWTNAVFPIGPPTQSLPANIPSFRLRPTRPRPFAPGHAR